MIDRFLGRRDRYNTFELACPLCQSTGELGVPHNRLFEVFGHGPECPALFIQQPPTGMFDNPHIVCVNDQSGAQS